MRTIYTCILGPYEKLKEPTVITPGWRYVCYTDQDFESSTWEIIKISVEGNPRATARGVKSKFFHYVDTLHSIYIDGSFQINCDLDLFWERYYLLPFSCPVHPHRKCVYEEAKSIISAQRGGREGIEYQIESYKDIVPPKNGVITSGILLRELSYMCMILCEEWAKETLKKGNSLRDQVSFAKASMDYKSIVHTFDYNYTQRTDFTYTPHRDVIINGVNFF